MSVAPGVRTHSLRSAYIDGEWMWECRGCGQRWNQFTDPNPVEQQPCGTRAPDPRASS